MSPFRTRLSWRLALIGVVAVAPAMAALAYTQSHERQRARERTLVDNLRLAGLAAAQQAAVFDGARRLLLTLAQFPPLSADNPQACNELLPHVLRDHPGYFNLTVANADGSLFCAGAPLDSPLLASGRGRPWFERAKQTRTTAVGDYQMSVTTGKPAIIVAHPLFDSAGALTRVIAATIGLGELNTVASRAELPRGATLTLFTRGRTILVRFPDSDSLVGKSIPDTGPIERLTAGARDDVRETFGVDGIRRLYVTVPVSASVDTGLYVGMGVEHDTAFGEADRIFHQYLWLLALVSLTAIGAAVMAARMFVLKPVKALKAVTERLAAGDLSARAQLASSVAGVSELGDAVNAMAVQLDARQRERDHAQGALRASEDRYRLLFAQNPHPMWVYDVATLEFLEVNDAAVQHYGYSRSEFLAMRIADIRPADDVSRLLTSVGSAREPFMRSGGWRHRLKTGEIIDVEITSHTLEFAGRPAVLVTAQDVTARIQAEAALAERTALTMVSAEVGVALNRPGELRASLQSCAEVMVAYLDATVAQIWTIGQASDFLELEASAGTDDHVNAPHRRLRVGQSAIGRIAQERRRYVTNDVGADPDVHDRDWVRREGVVTSAGWPLIVGGRVVGVMALYSRRPFSDAVVTGLTSVAALLALGVTRHQAEEARRLLAAIVASSDDAILSTTLDGAIMSWNAGAETLFGYVADEVVGRSVSLLYPPERAEELADLSSRLRSGEHVTHRESVRLRKDGSRAPVSLTLSPIKDATGQVTGTSTIVRDISERQQTERTLRDSEERFRRIAATVTQVFWIADVDIETMIYVSPAYERIWGRSCQSLHENPRSFLEAVHMEDRERVIAVMRAQQSGQPFEHEYRIVRPDGEVRWIWDRGFPVRAEDGRVVQYVGVAEDITDRRRAEEHIRLLARALESTNEMISVTDLDSRFTFVNSAFLRAYGYTADEVMGRSPALVQSRRLPDGLLEEIVRESRRDGWKGEVLNRRKDGTEFFVSLNTSAIRDEQGTIVGLLGVARDITERLGAERALRDAEERMRFALEASHVGVWEVNLKTGVTYWSATCERMHGLAPGTFERTREAFIGHIHPDDREHVRAAIEQAIRDHKNAELEYQTVWADGSVHRISTIGHFSRDEDGVPIRGAGIAVDVTERRSLEDQLRQSQKMEAIGQLAGGIAHDFNNLLTAIQGFASFLAESLPEPDERHADVVEIQHAADRAAGLTRQLLAFSRKQILAVRVLHLGDVVGELAPMLRQLLGESVDLRTTVGDRGLVKADPGQLQQVLVNLAVNARDAMPENGRLTIETADVRLDQAFARHHPSVVPGPYVMLTVSDTGHGMDAATQKRVFEPFFTTKPMGQGTGLGLATAYGIVKQSGGSIWVYSEVGRGTTFKVYLPRTDEIAEADRPATIDPRALRGTETVLLVEDEDMVREFVYKVLSRRGYSVHAVANPTSALEYAQAQRATIALVFSDVVLPDMSGPSMVTQLQQRHPESKVLYMSGYADHAIVHQGVLEAGTAFLQKPFTADALARKVRDVLDA